MTIGMYKRGIYFVELFYISLRSCPLGFGYMIGLSPRSGPWSVNGLEESDISLTAEQSYFFLRSAAALLWWHTPLEAFLGFLLFWSNSIFAQD